MSNFYEPEFRPEDFGFQKMPQVRGRNAACFGRDYILKDNRGRLILSMCSETNDFVTRLIGENSCNVYCNDRFQILLTPGRQSVISRSNHQRSRSSVSVTYYKAKLIRQYGEFRRLYLDCKPYGRGNAVLFTPTNEKDV